MPVFTSVKKEDAVTLKKLGFTPLAPKTIYEVIRYQKDNVTLILYESEKLLLQGKAEAVDKITDLLLQRGIGTFDEKKEIKFRKETGWMIGSDESLKGDTFGGVVVAAVKADKKLREKLQELGVADSKKLSDKEIMTMADKIRKIVPCEIKSILPEKYNKSGKITEMLNKYHQECANFLQPGKHVVDKYPGCNVGDIRETKAESKYIEVAAASVLAREAALKQLNFLSVLASFPIPKGSTHVKLALHELKERGLDFKKFVKVDFKNVREFL
jgi:ribonuclease HIII